MSTPNTSDKTSIECQIGDYIEVTLTPTRQGDGFCTLERINGRIAFMEEDVLSVCDLRAKDRWLVQVASENHKRTVYFLAPMALQYAEDGSEELVNSHSLSYAGGFRKLVKLHEAVQATLPAGDVSALADLAKAFGKLYLPEEAKQKAKTFVIHILQLAETGNYLSHPETVRLHVPAIIRFLVEYCDGAPADLLETLCVSVVSSLDPLQVSTAEAADFAYCVEQYGNLLQKRGDALAEKVYARLCSPTALYQRAICLKALGRFEEACIIFQDLFERVMAGEFALDYEEIGYNDFHRFFHDIPTLVDNQSIV
ncbi:MAG TPA: hypothetical protein PKC93_00395 [Candidatus Obscuribacter sp.]|nr:hypothetical protein [Candidatus Obscuribacter sp.]